MNSATRTPHEAGLYEAVPYHGAVIRATLTGTAAALTLTIASSIAAQVNDLPRDLPACAATGRSTAGWQEVRFRQFALTVPPGVRPVASSVVFEHGGQQWAGAGVGVSLALGYYGPQSFLMWEGTRCRAELDGHSALVIEQVTEKGASVAVWSPDMREACVSAISPTRDNLPVLRSIAFSLRVVSP